MMKSRYRLLVAILLIVATLVSGCTGRQEAAERPQPGGEGEQGEEKREGEQAEQPQEAAVGDTVKVHYTGKLKDGTVFDSSLEREPLEFTIGLGQLIPRFEDALIGMKAGESTTVTIQAQYAYGPYYNDLVLEVPRSQLPEDLEPHVGQVLSFRTESGTRKAIVVEVSELTVTLDANHPLAGKDLTFEIELLEIVKSAQ